MLCAGWQMGTLANTISSSLANCAIATLLVSSPRHLNLPFFCPKMIIATIVTWCRCQIMSSHFPRKSARQRLFGFLQEAYKGEIQCPVLPNQACFLTNYNKFHVADLQLLLLSSNQKQWFTGTSNVVFTLSNS